MAQFFKNDRHLSYYIIPSGLIGGLSIILYALFAYVLRLSLTTASAAAFTASILAGLIYLWPYCKKMHQRFFSTATFLFLLGWVGCAVIAFYAILIWPTIFENVDAIPLLVYIIMSLLFIPVNLIWRWMWTMFPEMVRYLVGGFFTFLVSFISYFLLTRYIPNFSEGIGMYVAKVLSWIFAVIFGFFINKYWVFENKTKGLQAWFKEFINFAAGRALTSAIFELGLFAIFVEVFGIYDLVATAVNTVLVVIANYFWSRFITFKKKKESAQ